MGDSRLKSYWLELNGTKGLQTGAVETESRNVLSLKTGTHTRLLYTYFAFPNNALF